MSELLLRAIERTEKANKARRKGFAPGVIYGEEMAEGLCIKFEMNKLLRVLKNHREGAKVQVKIGEHIKQCIVKEVQRDPITGKVLHIDLQTVTDNDTVRVKIPVLFKGKNRLEEKKLLLQVFLPEVEVAGKVNLLPEFITVDVENKELGDKITVKDLLKVNDEIKILNEEDEILAVVSIGKELDIASQ
ncbi:50S ribosomal protein L25 [Desulfotomaculum nigrificans CO-1-SRB]|uniref:Large ribosomal subunit protein bL25 n=1 Tax=Desulfotomaculum nigrificans (strain DSM 14880 / VKM B-2319 / CO-1-SRB) TaxID=868595 RepID=F6BA28_DESCC|nr:50S ribosomal protein L25 [Desulfotomaculum nigrificans]AEF94997.1 50S ribosomal protein L25 [Desulfotomaculum nigrificans CO-1-SRB]